LLACLALAVMASAACTQDRGNPPSGHGGAIAMGGAVQGGSSGGGVAATGGTVSHGGALGSGGAHSTGGGSSPASTSASGGTVSTDGAATGGAAGAGGVIGAGGGAGGVTGSGGATSDKSDAGSTAKDAATDGANDGPTPGDAGLGMDVAAQTCTGQPVPRAGDSNVTLQFGGRSRKYLLHAPSGLAAGMALAVVFDLHGAGGNGSQQKGMSGFAALADKEKFLVVFPDGVDGYWNVDDTCCGTAGKEKIDDVGFIKAILARLRTDICIDAKRVYVSGFSNGGGLTHRMGCDAADVIAAIAPVATDLRTQPCNTARPISMMEIRGMADSLEPYEGGMVGPAGGQYLDVGAKASLKLWADLDKCTGATTTFDKYCEGYTQCADEVEANLCSLPNTDHAAYDNALGFSVASTAWKMFQRQPMR
jgi:poly(3-hydroxybutyrate) depolymerase